MELGGHLMSQAVDEQELDWIYRNEKGTDTSQHRFLFILELCI
jgi:hypothetical protein